MKKVLLLVMVTLFVGGCGSGSNGITKDDLKENDWVVEIIDNKDGIMFDLIVHEKTIELTPTLESAKKVVEDEFGEDNVIGDLMIDALINESKAVYNYEMTDKGFALSQPDSEQGTDFILSREGDSILVTNDDDDSQFMKLTAK